jgi:hypothetical protein
MMTEVNDHAYAHRGLCFSMSHLAQEQNEGCRWFAARRWAGFQAVVVWIYLGSMPSVSLELFRDLHGNPASQQQPYSNF